VGVGQHEVLGRELDLHEPAARVLQVPGTAGLGAVLAEDALAHGADRGGQRAGVAGPGEGGEDHVVTRSARAGSPATTRARVEGLLLPDLGGLGW
jgi:hypothetical protein